MRKYTIASTTDPLEEIQFACGLTHEQPERTAYTVEQEVIHEEEQRDAVQTAQNQFLQDAPDYQEYQRRRDWMKSPGAIVQSRIRKDEMVYSDYRKARDQETGGRR